MSDALTAAFGALILAVVGVVRQEFNNYQRKKDLAQKICLKDDCPDRVLTTPV